MLRGKWFPDFEIPIDRILHFSLPSSLCLSQVKPIDLPLSLSSAFALDCRDSRSGSHGFFIAFHFRDELTRSIGAWQKCNAREVRGHPGLRSRARVWMRKTESARTSSASCELSQRARPCYETPIMRVKWGDSTMRLEWQKFLKETSIYT